MSIAKLANAFPIDVTDKVNEVIDTHGDLLAGLREDVSPFPGMISPTHTGATTGEYNWALSTLTTAAGHQIKAINIVQPAGFGSSICYFIPNSTDYTVGSELVVYFGSDLTCLPLRIVSTAIYGNRTYFVKPGEYVRLTAIAGNKWAVEAIKPGAGDGIVLDENGNVAVNAGTGLDFGSGQELKIADSTLTPWTTIGGILPGGAFQFNGGGYEKIGNKVTVHAYIVYSEGPDGVAGAVFNLTAALPRPLIPAGLIAVSTHDRTSSTNMKGHECVLLHESTADSKLELKLSADLVLGDFIYFTGSYISES
jgi:hypothetical protein